MGKTSYEVHTQREGRWRIEATFDDQNAAEALARAELTARGAEEVKVLKYRPFAGFEVEVCVYHRKAPTAGANGPMGLGGGADGAPLCQSQADIYQFESRLILGRLLRRFLDRFGITMSELLHGWTYARKLEDQGTLLRATVSAVARHHAEVHGADLKTRTRELTGWSDRAIQRLRDFNTHRARLTPLDWRDLDRSSRRLALDVGEEAHNFHFLCQITESLLDQPGLLAKVERLLDPWEESADPRVSALLEGIVADALGTATVVRELLGAQPHLGASLGVLADSLLARPPSLDGEPVSPTLSRIARLIVEGRATLCQWVLIERIRSAVAGEQPLDRRDPTAEPRLLRDLEKHLTGLDGGFLGGGPMRVAFERRAARQRQAMLRGIGMDDIADNVGRPAV